MKLITRSDFDGLACAVLLKEAGIIDSWKFAHPKDLQDGLVEVTKNDCLANVPYVEGCGLWFDHHASEEDRQAHAGKYEGDSRPSPSAAHIIYDYYGGRKKFPRYDDLLAAVDKVDSADLTREEILNPQGWILLGFIMDPRTGLGRFHDFQVSNYQLMEKLIDWCRAKSIEEIMALPDIVERSRLYADQTEKFIDMVRRRTVTEEQVVVSDLRGLETIYAGNRFMIYSLYPEQNISVWIVSGRDGKGCSAAVGHSVLNRTSKVNVGRLMLKYGGGGHPQVGTCQFPSETMDAKLEELIAEIKTLNKQD
ncbi:MAG: exopolyphosphatase [Gracilibacteraceae bacterium]|jgi:nanoRNase/pAp phosphatase (c-di-AMP/oligoRNAs hydrolase)|nr:exopolyphosphatase [Gracilibacteraceae bacterium]